MRRPACTDLPRIPGFADVLRQFGNQLIQDLREGQICSCGFQTIALITLRDIYSRLIITLALTLSFPVSSTHMLPDQIFVPVDVLNQRAPYTLSVISLEKICLNLEDSNEEAILQCGRFYCLICRLSAPPTDLNRVRCLSRVFRQFLLRILRPSSANSSLDSQSCRGSSNPCLSSHACLTQVKLARTKKWR